MLGWAILFFLIAVAAAIFGFGGIATTLAGVAQIIFFVFMLLFVLSLFGALARGDRRSE